MPGFGAVGEYAVGDTPAAGAIVIVPVVAALASMLSPTVLGGGYVTPPVATVNVVAQTPQPAGGGGPLVTETIDAVAAVYEPFVAAGGGAIAPPINATFDYELPTILGGTYITNVSLNISATLNVPQPGGGARVVGVTIDNTASTYSPQVAGGGRIIASNESVQIIPSGGVGFAPGEFAVGNGPSDSGTFYEPIRARGSLKAPRVLGGGGSILPPIDIEVTYEKPSISARPRRVRITTIASTES